MAISGCMNPFAANYNPQATSDDGSCYYVNKIGGVCYAFQDVAPGQLIDKSFTMSWSVVDDNWVFFHDYIPDFYFATREQIYALKTGRIYQMNNGLPGAYFSPTPSSFFVDVVFNSDKEMTLNALKWVTEVLNTDGSASTFETLTHITIWNSSQCSGRIALSQVYKDLQYDIRKTQGEWMFNNFRDKILVDGVAFLQDIFHNFAVNPGAVSDNVSWIEQELMEDTYFVIRFEFDNTTGKKIYLENVNIDINPSMR